MDLFDNTYVFEKNVQQFKDSCNFNFTMTHYALLIITFISHGIIKIIIFINKK